VQPLGKVHFKYVGSQSGLHTFYGGWSTQSYPASDKCPDTNTGDGVLECDLEMVSGTTNFKFTVKLPNGAWWGDVSNDPLGGKGNTNGTVTLTLPNATVIACPVTNKTGGTNVCYLKSNGSGPDYRDGWVDMFQF
jgi:hypothetical protein